jgi:hypothetical protein
MRNGSVQTQSQFDMPMAVKLEGRKISIGRSEFFGAVSTGSKACRESDVDIRVSTSRTWTPPHTSEKDRYRWQSNANAKTQA